MIIPMTQFNPHYFLQSNKVTVHMIPTRRCIGKLQCIECFIFAGKYFFALGLSFLFCTFTLKSKTTIKRIVDPPKKSVII